MKIMSRNKKAFGLIETLIACAVMIMITGALLTIHVVTTRNISYIKHRAQAYNLASEGIESVRQIRETNLVDGLETTTWNSFVCSGDRFLVPYPDTSYEVMENLSCGSSGFPRYSLRANSSGQTISNLGTAYTRKIRFRTSGIDPEVKAPASIDDITTESNSLRVDVEVSWKNNGRDFSVSVSEVLTNWKQGI